MKVTTIDDVATIETPVAHQNNLKKMAKRLFSLALPMATVQFITVASGFLGMAMLAQLGHTVLAASGLFFSTQIAIIVSAISLLFSLGILIGHSYGAKDYLGIGNYVQQGWTLGLFLSLPVMLIYWHIGPLLILCGQSPVLVQIVQSYFHAAIWGVIPLMFSVTNQQLCYGTNKQSLVTLTNLLCVGVLLSAAYILIFGKLGMKPLGVAGLGYAISMQNWFYCLFTLLVFSKHSHFKPFKLFSYRVHKGWEHIARMFKIGWPISMQMGGEMLSFFVCAAMVGWLGTHALAAYQVVNQYLFLVVIPLFSLSQASGVLIGQACGSKNYTDIPKLGQASVIFAFVMCAVVATVFLFLPKTLARVYVDISNPENASTVHYVVMLFALIAVAQFFDGVKNVLTGSLRGLLDSKFPMYAGLFVIWFIGIPLSYLFGFVLHFGLIGISLGMSIGMIISCGIIIQRWRLLSQRMSGLQ